MPRVMVAMSGGVDSSVAAYLLQRQGYDCIGATMRLYENALVPPGLRTCCSLDDVEDARDVAALLGMRHYTFDFIDEFARDVIAPFVDSYERGLTPNPCIECNRRMKFGLLLSRARDMGCDFVATGHYARIEPPSCGPDGLSKRAFSALFPPDRPVLRRAVDASKDQSYVLAVATPDELAHTLLPLGGLTKREVRAIAERAGLPTASKRESQDICFIPDGDYVSFLERESGSPLAPGDVVDERGAVLGTHRGMAAYTIGQRKGLGIAAKEPLYVCGKDASANRVVVGPKSSLLARGVVAGEWNWIAAAPGEPVRVRVKTAYRQQAASATLRALADGRVEILYDGPRALVAPGQTVVAYAGDAVVGGGIAQGDLRPAE